MRRLLLLTLFLLLIPSTLAVWDTSTDIEEFNSGDVWPLGDGIVVRVIEVGDVENIVFLNIEKDGRTVASGSATKRSPLVVDDMVMISYHGDTTYQTYGATARLQAHHWVDGRFVAAHFPKAMNLKTLYDVFAVVENTGARGGEFTVELTQAGEYVRMADRYEDEFGNLIPRLVDVQQPQEPVYLGVGAQERVVYERISAVRRQPSGNTPIERSADILMNLYYKGTLLDSIIYRDVEITQGQTGYLQDIRIPQLMRNDQPMEVEIDVVNGGQAFGGIERSKFNVRMRNPDFVFTRSTREFKTTELDVHPDLLRGDVPAFLTKTWKFKVTPYVPSGHYELVFDLEHQGKVLDSFMVPVEVRDGASTRITKLEVPERVELGDTIPVLVEVKNSGLGRRVSVIVDGPMIEDPSETVVSLGPEEVDQLQFNIEATGQGLETIEAKVVVKDLNGEGKNFDPYNKDTGYTVNSRSTQVFIKTGFEEEFEVQQPVVEQKSEPKPEVVSKPAPVPANTPEPEPTFVAPTIDASAATPIMVVALVILVILIILKALFQFTEG